MDKLEIAFTEIIESINLKKFAIFCGAGVSRNSGLPIVSQFLSYLLGKFDIQNDDLHYLLDKENNPKIPFEVFIKYLLKHTKQEQIYEIYKKGLPNTNHIFIAKLAKAGKINTIVTTNFDKLIERAFNNEGLIEGKDYDLVFTEEDLGKIDWKREITRIIKIHGSIDDKRSMAITINQIASKKLTLPRQEIIKYLFSEGKHDIVLVIGYSCSDVFDLTPNIESIKDNKIVYLIQHSNKNSIEDISKIPYSNPFIKYQKSQRISYNTNTFVKKIWESTLSSEYKFVKGMTDWKYSLDDWYIKTSGNHSNAIEYIVLGELYFFIAEYNIAERYYKIALKKHKEKTNDKIEEIIYGNLGNIYHAQRKYFKSLYSYNYALKIAIGQGNKIGESSWLGGIGNVFFTKEKYKKAKKYYMKALTALEETNNIENKGKWLGSIGNIYYLTKEYSKARKYYEEAIIFSRYVGDIQSECAWLGNLGNSFMILGNKKNAKKLYINALEISMNIGDKKNQELWSKKLKQIDEKDDSPEI